MWHFALGAGIAIVVGCSLAFLYNSAARIVRYDDAFRGPPIAGTAEVLSACRQGGRETTYINWAVVCRFELRVHLPDRLPYQATVKAPVSSDVLVDLCVRGQRWELDQQWKVKPHSVFAVLVDSADPSHVRIDFRRPIESA